SIFSSEGGRRGVRCRGEDALRGRTSRAARDPCLRRSNRRASLGERGVSLTASLPRSGAASSGALYTPRAIAALRQDATRPEASFRALEGNLALLRFNHVNECVMTVFETIAESGPLLRDAVRSGNLRVLASMLGPAFRGLIRHRGRNEESTPVQLGYRAHFD